MIQCIINDTGGAMETLINDLKKYINLVLGIDVDPYTWEREKGMPFLLQNTYGFFGIKLLNLEIVLIINRNDQDISPAVVRKHMDMVKAEDDNNIIYVKKHVTAYNRKRMIEHGLPFIIPGKQMFLPMLAIDLREHFLQKQKPVNLLSPSAQVLALYFIYNQLPFSKKNMSPTALAKELGYSKMTMTRAIREITTVLSSQSDEHSSEILYEQYIGKNLWEKIKLHMTNPVAKRLYCQISQSELDYSFRAGGLTALSQSTQINPPETPVVVFEKSEWKKFAEYNRVIELLDIETGVFEIEIWSYQPGLLTKDNSIDPLSLYLSLENMNDERIAIELTALLEEVF